MKERLPMLIFAILILVIAFLPNVDEMKPSQIFIMIGVWAGMSAAHPFRKD